MPSAVLGTGNAVMKNQTSPALMGFMLIVKRVTINKAVSAKERINTEHGVRKCSE